MLHLFANIPSPTFLVFLFLLGIVSGIVAAFVVGGLTLVALSSMLFLGVPIPVANATNKVGTFVWRIGALKQLWKSRNIVWEYVLPFSVLSIVGAMLGAHFLVTSDSHVLNVGIGVLLILSAFLMLANKNLGVVKFEPSRTLKIIGYILIFISAVLYGISPAVGSFFTFIYLWCFGLTQLEIAGTAKVPGILLDFGALIILFSSGNINFYYALAFAPGAYIGASIGMKKIIDLGDKWLRIFVFLGTILVGIKLMF